MQLLVVTGLSGAGKSQALRVAEDLGYFCVDNLPPMLLPKFIEIIEEAHMPKVAIVLDIRSGAFFPEIKEALNSLKRQLDQVKILYLEASQDVLVNRYKELRRPHPLSQSIVEGVKLEAEQMKDLRKQADFIIDTSKLTNHTLKARIQHILSQQEGQMSISVMSFGFKYGILEDADLIFDVRFIPNPYYIPELKHINGTKRQTQEYVLKWKESQEFLDKVEDLIEFLIPNYLEQGKNQLIIGLGCTGGFHRSVALGVALTERLEKNGHNVLLAHREEGGKW